MSRTTLLRTAFAAAVVLQLVVLYAPRAPSPPAGWRVDLVVHLVVFALVAWTGRRAGVGVRPLLLVLAAHALLSEAVQQWLLPGRSGDLVDVLADLVGTGLGLLLPSGSRRR